jgi:hypothetical protein
MVTLSSDDDNLYAASVTNVKKNCFWIVLEKRVTQVTAYTIFVGDSVEDWVSYWNHVVTRQPGCEEELEGNL